MKLLCFLLSLAFASAVDFQVEWRFPDNGSYADLDVSPGDNIIFDWSQGGNHNVWLYDNDACVNNENSVELASNQVSSYTYAVTEEDAGKTLNFTCEVPNHCSFFGMVIRVNVSIDSPQTSGPTLAPTPTEAPTLVPTTFAPTLVPTTFAPTLVPTTFAPTGVPTFVPTTSAPTAVPTFVPTTFAPTAVPTFVPTTSTPSSVTTEPPTTASPTVAATTAAPSVQTTNVPIDWSIPATGDSLPGITVNPGDNLVFTWTGNHDLVINSDSSCTLSSTAQTLAGPSDMTFTFPVLDAFAGSMIHFLSSVEGDCTAGLKIAVNVTGSSNGGDIAPGTYPVCNLCPVGTSVTIPGGVLQGNECGASEQAGLNGQISPVNCQLISFAQSLITETCGCAGENTPTTTPAPTPEPTSGTFQFNGLLVFSALFLGAMM